MELTVIEEAGEDLRDRSLDPADQSEDLKERLLELQVSTSSPMSLCRSNPEKWMKVAVAVCRGDSVTGTKKELNIGQKTYYIVLRDILDIRKKYTEFQISNIDANIDAADNVTSDMLEVLQDSVEVLKTDFNYDKAKATEAIASGLDRIQKSAVSMAMRKGKLLDKPDIVVENRGPIIDYEARKEELLAMRKAEAIDVTEEDV